MSGGAGKSNTPGGAADPLASVITQVQPGQASGAGASFANRSGAGPARPTRVAKKVATQQTQQQQTPTSAPPAASSSSSEPRKKKKKRRSSRPAEVEGGEGKPSKVTGITREELMKGVKTSDTSSGIAGTSDAGSSAGGAAPALTGASTTLPTDGSAQGQTQTGAGASIATTPGTVEAKETDAAARNSQLPTEQGTTQTTEKLQQPSSGEGKVTPTAASPNGPPAAAVSSSAHNPAAPSIDAKPISTGPTTKSARPSSVTKQPKKPSALKKLVAFLTCSSVALEDGRDKRSSTSTSHRPSAKEGSNIEMKERIGTGKDRHSGGSAAGVAATQTGKDARPKVDRADGSKASSAKQLQEQQQSQRNASKLTPLSGKATLGGAAAGAATGIATLTATHHHGRPGSSSARNSLESRSETGVIAPPPGTLTPGGGTQLPREETGDVMSGAVVPPGSAFVTVPSGSAGGRATPTPSRRDAGSVGRPGEDKGMPDDETDEYTDDDEGETESDTEDSEAPTGILARAVTSPGQDEFINQDEDDVFSEEQRLIAQGGMGIPLDANGDPKPLLEPLGARDSGRKCLVLDLDETLVHSSFKMINNADFVVPVEIEGTVHNVYVIKRPGVDEFMRKMGLIYEVVVFTASLSKYADPVLDILDIHQVVRHRLFRESCYNHRGNYVKDLSQLGRPIEESIIIDNSPASYIFHPNNAVPISSWFNDPHDTELTDLCPFLADLSEVADVRAVLDGGMSITVAQ